MNRKKKYPLLDWTRIIAAILVVTIHTGPLSSFSEDADFVLTRILARMAVPFFLLITGYFMGPKAEKKGLGGTAAYFQKLGILYVLSILIYLPLNIYAGYFQEDFSVLNLLKDIVFDGTFYHLWYLPAAMLGIVLTSVLARAVGVNIGFMITLILYVIGLLGDSYYGITEQIPVMKTMYDGMFRLFDYTRNGFFMAPVFLMEGMWIRRQSSSEKQGHPEKQTEAVTGSLALHIAGLFICIGLLVTEGLTVRHYELSRHDSMYVTLPLVMYFLFSLLLQFNSGQNRRMRSRSLTIYLIHPWMIVAVRGVAKALHMETLLIEQSLVHFLTVLLCSAAFAELLILLMRANRKAKVKAKKKKKREQESAEKRKQDLSDEIIKVVQEQMLFSEHPELRPEQDVVEGYPDVEETAPEDETETAADITDDPLSGQKTDDEPGTEQKPPVKNSAGQVRMKEIGSHPSALTDGEAVDDNGRQKSQERETVRPAAASRKSSGGQKSVTGQKHTAQSRPAANAKKEEMAEQRALLKETAVESRRAWSVIDLDAICENVYTLKKMLPDFCEIMAVVKANGYGHGDIQTAQALSGIGIHAFAVATLDEGIRLRRGHIRGEILILGYTDPRQASLLEQYDLSQTIVDGEYGQRLNKSGHKIKVHIGIDSGMHRLGIPAENTEQVEALYQYRNLNIQGIFSHLCVSDSLKEDDVAFTHEQITRFFRLVNHLQKNKMYTGSIHIQASFGIVNYGDLELPCHYARAGLVMYGVLSDEENSFISRPDLKPAMSLYARIGSVRQIGPGDAVSYGRIFKARETMKIGAVTAGYADGIPRCLSDARSWVLIKGRKAPVIGRICMDQFMVDLRRIPDVKPGDRVTIIGTDGQEQITCEMFAKWCDTIPHEIMCGLGSRVKKVYKTGMGQSK